MTTTARLSIIAALLAAAMLPTINSALAVDLSAPVVQLDGKPFVDKDGKPVDMILGTVIENALLSQYPDDANQQPVDKLKRFSLGQKMHGKKDIDFSASDLKLIEDYIAKAYPVAIMGAVWSLIDPAGIPK